MKPARRFAGSLGLFRLMGGPAWAEPAERLQRVQAREAERARQGRAAAPLPVPPAASR